VGDLNLRISLTCAEGPCNLANHRREHDRGCRPNGDPLRLLLETRDVGRVTIVRCKGRLVSGSEAEALRAHVTWILRDRRSIVLHLGDVVFIDSSGLGTMVRTLTSTRQVHGDLKLCDVPESIRKVLELSHLHKLFDSHETEDHAVAAFYRTPVQAEKPVSLGRSVLCVDRNADVVTYVRELLRRAGYDVHTSNNLRDALILMRVSRFDLLLVGAELSASPATEKSFRDVCAAVPLIELGTEFSTLDAGEAASALLEKIAAQLQLAS
jgi:anti-sigma B factor antagonist